MAPTRRATSRTRHGFSRTYIDRALGIAQKCGDQRSGDVAHVNEVADLLARRTFGDPSTKEVSYGGCDKLGGVLSRSVRIEYSTPCAAY